MNGIEKITARITADAEADAARIVDEARAQCEAVRAEGEARAQESYWRRVREGVKATEDRVQRLNKTADMEARKSVLSCKLGVVDEAFSLAEQKLRAMTGDEYVSLLASLAARASTTGTEEIVLSAADGRAYGEAVTARANELLAGAGKTAALTLSREAGAFEGGLILRSGSISVNCTIEALMAEARQELASFAAAELFS